MSDVLASFAEGVYALRWLLIAILAGVAAVSALVKIRDLREQVAKEQRLRGAWRLKVVMLERELAEARATIQGLAEVPGQRDGSDR